MEKKDVRNEPFPKEYAHLEEIVKETENQIKLIDKEIETRGKNSGPAPRLNPPGYHSVGNPNKFKTIEQLEYEKGQIIDKTITKIEKGSKDASPEIRKSIKEKSLFRLDRNNLEDLSKDQLGNIKTHKKDIELSQKFADAQIRHARNRNIVQNAKGNEPKQEMELKKNEKPMSMSQRFSQSLSSNKFMDEKGRDVEATSKNSEKGMTMSQKFSQSLSSSKSLENSKGPDLNSKDKEPDMDR
jgi:hypothetical protein